MDPFHMLHLRFSSTNSVYFLILLTYTVFRLWFNDTDVYLRPYFAYHKAVSEGNLLVFSYLFVFRRLIIILLLLLLLLLHLI
jgi:hypothetical protein